MLGSNYINRLQTESSP